MTCLGVAVTLRLGFWQISRAHEKQAIHNAIAAQQQAPALNMQALLSQPQAFGQTYRSVALQGEWLGQWTVYLDNRQMKGQVGFWVFTPLRLDATHTVLVQRGWVARNFEDRNKLIPVNTPSGLVQVNGRLIPPPSELFALSSGDSGQEPSLAVSRIRQNLNMSQFAQETGLDFNAVVLQTQADADGLRRDWPEISTGVEKHWGYAFQWFAMAATQVLLYFWFQWIKPYRHATKQSPR